MLLHTKTILYAIVHILVNFHFVSYSQGAISLSTWLAVFLGVINLVGSFNEEEEPGSTDYSLTPAGEYSCFFPRPRYKMEETAADLGNLFRAITIQLASLTSAVHSQGVASIVPTLSGKPSEFKYWIKAFQRYEILTRVDDEKLKGITLQTAQGPVADFIARWMSDHQDQNWAQLRAE